MDASSIPYDHETEDAIQSHRRDEKRAPRLTRTDPSRKVYPRQLHAPAGPERNHRGQAEPCHTISYDVNTVLLQHLPDLLNIIHIHASNTNATLNLAVTVLNNFKLKRDTVQAKDDLPAQ